MGIFDFINKYRKKRQDLRYAKMLNGQMPIYSQFGTNIYASDVVQQAVYTIVTEMKKLNPKHIRRKGFDYIPVDDSNEQWALDHPNPLMTTSEFIEKFMWNLELNYNSFIYKQYDDKGNLMYLWPLSPVNVTFLEDATGRIYVDMLFKNGYKSTVPYSSLIHLRSHYSVNDMMGGNEQGQPDNGALLQTLSLNDILLQGLKKALNASFAINGIVKYNTMLDDGSMKQNIKDFEEKIQNSQSGILGIDNKADVIQFKRDIAFVDEATLKFIDDKILRNFGVPVDILRGSYTNEQYEAFYQKTLEHRVIDISQKFTQAIFTERQKGFKNEIKFYPKELIFMNTQQTLEMVHELGQTGTLFENEKRVAFGYNPLPELNGVRLQSLNYVSVDIAKEYQMNGQKDTDPKDPGGEEDGEEQTS